MPKKKEKQKTINVRGVYQKCWAKVIGLAADEDISYGAALNKILKSYFKIK